MIKQGGRGGTGSYGATDASTDANTNASTGAGNMDIADMEETKSNTAGSRLFCSSRFAIAIVGFLGFVNLYALRVNMSVAMVCMINNTALDLQNPPDANKSSPGDDLQCGPSINSTSNDQDGEFDWSRETQGIILGAFFWGYLVTQIPGGWLAERIGGKGVFGWCMLVCSVATLLTPIGAKYSPYMLVGLRIVKGLGQGVVFPAMHSIWSVWAPPLERSILIGFTYAGAQIGNVITFPISGVLCDSVGWEAIFYVFGSLGVAWFFLWMLVASNNPASHKWIRPEEREYIEDSLGTIGDEQEKRKNLGTPWVKILTSLPVWAIVVGHTCANWGTYTLLTNIPTYMKEVLRFDIKANGFFSAIPYICFWIMINASAWMADWLRGRGWKTGLVRKIMYTVGTIGPGVGLIATGFVSCETPYVAVAMLAFATGLSGIHYSGVMVNHVDIAPPFSGVLFGLSNTFATLSGILAPYAVGVITTDGTSAQWQTVFYVAAAIYTFGAIFFCIFADGEVQEWVKPYLESVVKDPTIETKVVPSEKSDLAMQNDGFIQSQDIVTKL